MCEASQKTWKCTECGAEFVSRKHKSTCSESCYRQRQARNGSGHKLGKATCECAWCLAEFSVKNGRMYCSKACAGKHKSWCVAHGVLAEARMQREIDRKNSERSKRIAATKGPHTRVTYCEKHGWSRSWGRGKCAACCQTKRNHETGGVDVSRLACAKCGSVFCADRKRSVCDECKRKAEREALRRSNLRRDRMIAAAAIDAMVTRESVWKRQGGRCAMCKRKTTMRKESTPRQATIDHIVPISKGGTHTQDNTQLLCRDCNCKRKGDKAFGQRFLVGFA